MSVLNKFKDFCLEIKANRDWKEEKWRFIKNDKAVHFMHKKHIFDLSVFVLKDKRTYVIEEEGTKKISDEEWEEFYKKIQGEDVLFIFKGEDKKFERTVAFGTKAEKIKELYDEVIKYKKQEHGIEINVNEIKMNVEGRVYPIELIFDWDNGALIIKDRPRKLNKSFTEKEEIQKYMQ